ncbi:beta strand repeat-containing protein [Roseimicrobium gellanilyticum]|nr:autotransporter-associated beta strand repeat-containing protein [Roseimicrobium gellanilyticum]
MWSDPLNWSTDTLPLAGDDLTFGLGSDVLIHLDGNRTLGFNTFTFDTGGTISLGAAGTNNVLAFSATSPNLIVDAGTTLNLNAIITGALSISGGGTVVMNNFFTQTGNITVDGAGTTLKYVHRSPLSHGTGGLSTVRSDWPTLGPIGGTVEVITLTNGGELLLVGPGHNPDGSTKNIVLGTGGGAINVRNGMLNLDDGSQIGGTGQLIKRGAGRLVLSTQAYALAGGSKVEAGFLEVNNAGSFATTATHVVDGGVFGIGTGTTALTIVHGGITLNTGGALGVSGADHVFGSGSAASVITLNGGTILAADYADGRTARLPRFNSYLQGSGTVQIVGGNGGNHRVVLQRGDALQSTFSGRFVLNDFTAIENNPGNASGTGRGNGLGSATVEFKGVNAILDLRDDGAGSNTSLTDYSGIKLDFTGTQKGSIYSLAANRTGSGSTNTGNSFQLGSLSIGDHYLDVNAANSYQLAINGPITIKGSAVIATRANGSTNGGLLLNSNVAENAAGRTLTKIGANTSATNTSQLSVAAQLQVSNVNVVQGTLNLQGVNGSIGLGAVSGATTITISSSGVLRLDDSAAVASGQRVDAGALVVMKGGTISLQSNVAAATNSDQTIENLTVSGGLVTFDATRNNAGARSVLQLGGTTTWSRAANAGVNFTGTSLGLAGNSGRILINGQAAGFMGGWATVGGTEFAKYDTSSDSGYALGVTSLVAADYSIDPLAAGYTTGVNVKFTNNATPVALTTSSTVNSLNFQLAAGMASATDTITLGGAANLLRVESGGILFSGGNNAFIDHNTLAANKGQITAGAVTDTAATLYITINGTATSNSLDIGARIVNNGTGALTLVKNGTGDLRLTNTNTAATNNSFTGGLFINQGRVIVYATTGGIAPVLSSDVTLTGGGLEFHTNNLTGTINTGRNINVTGNGSQLGLDNNTAATNANGSNQNVNVTFGTLTLNAPYSGDNAPTLSFGGFDSVDATFSTMNISNSPVIHMLSGRDNNSSMRAISVTGSGGFTMTQADTTFDTSTSAILYLGNGSGDNVANTYTGDIIVRGGRLVIDKGVNVTAITGDLIIAGGTVSWAAQGRGNNFAANSKVYLLSGRLGQTDEATTNGATNDYDGYVPELIMKGGTLNTGRRTFTVNKATISGGTVEVQGVSGTAATLTLNTTELLHGAPNINLRGDASADLTVLELGGTYFKTSGQSIVLTTAAGNFSAGSEVRILTDVQVTPDPFAANSYSSGISITAGRELMVNHRIDFGGGIRDFDIGDGAYYTIVPYMVNGGLTKSGLGTLILGSYLNESSYAENVTVNAGTLIIRNSSSLGAAAGGTTVESGATLEAESGVVIADNLTLAGFGAADKMGALVSYRSANRFTGSVTLTGDAAISTMATSLAFDSAVAPTGLSPYYSLSELRIAGAVGGTGTLHLRGEGYGFLDGGVTTAGGLVKDGSGYWTLAGASTYTGFTDITAGVLRTSTTLGNNAQGTRVLGGASLVFTGNVSYGAEALELHGTGHPSQDGVLVNASGNNSLSGLVTLVTDAQNSTVIVNSASGSLSLTGGVSSATNANLVLSGDGSGLISGGIAIGSGTLTKNGTGTWTLDGAVASTFTGATTVNAGTLVVNTAVSQLADGAALNLAGGGLSLVGNGTETVTGLNLLAGGAEIDLGAATLNAGALSRTAGATVNFAAAGNITTSAVNTNGILGAYATVGGINWASVSGGVVSAFSSYVTLYEDTGITGAGVSQTTAPTATLATVDNILINLTQQNFTTTGVSANSLKINGATTRGIGQKNTGLTIGSGGILYTGGASDTTGLAGTTGTLTAGGGELFFHVNGGTLDVNMIVAGTNGITKDGSGTLILNGGNTFTGNIAVNEGTLAIVGPGGTADPTALGAAGARTVTLNGGTFSVIAGAYDPGANTKAFVIGPDGGTLHVGGGDAVLPQSLLSGVMTLNDASQLSGTGTLIKTGSGRLILGTQTFAFSGDVIVREGILVTQAENVLGGRLANQTITVEDGAMLQHGIVNFDGSLVMKDGSYLMGRGNGTTHFLNGQVSMDGTVGTYLYNAENFGQSINLVLNNRVTLTAGSTWNIYGRSNANFVSLNGPNDIAGSIKLHTNATLIANYAGSLGNATNRANVELAGANSRLVLKENTTADFNINLTASANSTLELRFGGAYSNHFFSINNLTIADDRFFTLGGANGEQLVVAGTTNFQGDAFFVTNLNAVLRNVVGNGGTIGKQGSATSTLYLTGASDFGGGVYKQYSGNTQLVQSGVMSNLSSLVIKGGRFSIDNTQGGFALNRLPDATSVTMYGGELYSSGNETIGNLTVWGSTNIHVSLATDTPGTLTAPSVLRIGGTIQASRKLGGTIDFRADSGGGLGSTGANPRIVFTGEVATLGFLGGGFTNGNDWVQYNASVDGGSPRGIVAFNSYTTNPLVTAWGVGTHANFDSSSAVTYTLDTHRSLLSLRFNAGGTRTIDLDAFNLTIVSGGILVPNTGSAISYVIGGSTADTGILTAGTAGDGIADELFIHTVNGNNNVTINAGIADNTANGTVLTPDSLSVIKDQGGVLLLLNNNNSFTGGLYVNEGTVQSNNAAGAFGQAGSDIILQGGTLNVRHDGDGTTAAQVIFFDQDLFFRADSTVSADRVGTTATTKTIRFNGMSIDDAIATFTNANSFAYLINNGGTFSNASALNNTANVTIRGGVSKSGTFVKSGAGTLELGTPDLLDNTPNTFTGETIINAGAVDLKKTAGTTAIGGNVTLNGGSLNSYAANLMDDATNITVNNGTVDFRNNSDVIGSVTVNGGVFRTSSVAVVTASTVVISGDLTVNSVTQNNSVLADSGTTLQVNGLTRVRGLGRIETGASGTFQAGGGLELSEGASIRVSNGASVSNLNLGGTVTSLASDFVNVISGDNDSDSFFNLALDNDTATTGTVGTVTRDFVVQDGAAEDDLFVNVRMRNSNPGGVLTTAGDGTVGFRKLGAGSMVISGTQSNLFTGAVFVDAGRLDLRKDVGVNAITGSALNIAAGATVRQLASNQIIDAATLEVNGTYNLDYGNASETVAGISGTEANAQILLGPGSTLTTTTGAGVVTYAGHIYGTGASTGATTTGGVVKGGAGAWQLTGSSEFSGNLVVNAGELSMAGTLKGNTTYVKTGATLSGTGTMANVLLEGGSTLKPGAVNDGANTAVGTLRIAGDLNAATTSTIRMQLQSATTTTDFGGNAIGSAGYVSFLTNEANTNAAWKSQVTGTMDHLSIEGYLGNNGDVTIVSGTQFTINALGGYMGTYGDVFNLIDWTGIMTSTGWLNGGDIRGGGDLGDLDLPTLTLGLDWDTRLFASHGILLVVPEPSRALLLLGGLGFAVSRRRRKQR